ncbi:hypothetical protein C8R44DRAFT_741594 [Mycena epipterygia]|nr:hypothetical protein C8R44DRAFT_741594 [Mycena epipterygia]
MYLAAAALMHALCCLRVFQLHARSDALIAHIDRSTRDYYDRLIIRSWWKYHGREVPNHGMEGELDALVTEGRHNDGSYDGPPGIQAQEHYTMPMWRHHENSKINEWSAGGNLDQSFLPSILQVLSYYMSAQAPTASDDLPDTGSESGSEDSRLSDDTAEDMLVEQLRQLVEETLPRDHPDLPGYQYMLGYLFAQRYKNHGDLNALELARQHLQGGVDLTPNEHPDRSERLENLAHCYWQRYWEFEELEDLEAVVQKGQECMDLTPENHPDRARRLQVLAGALFTRYKRLGDPEDLQASWHGHQEIDTSEEPCIIVHGTISKVGRPHRLRVCNAKGPGSTGSDAKRPS